MEKTEEEFDEDFRTQDYDESDPFGLLKVIVIIVFAVCFISMLIEKLV